MNSKIVAIIPARGNSKSVPRKNIKPLAGKPLLAYTIEEAKKCAEIDRLIVSTEDEEIARLAKDWGAEVPFLRPRELSEDAVTDLPVFQHSLQWLKEKESFIPEIVIHLRPTSPLRKATHIQEAIDLFRKNDGVDCVRSVSLAPAHPLKMWRVETGSLIPFIPEAVYNIHEAYNWPRQKLPPAYVQNGAIEVVCYETIMKKNSMSGERIKAYLMPEEDSINIDSLLDFLLAEQLLKQRNEDGKLYEG